MPEPLKNLKTTHLATLLLLSGVATLLIACGSEKGPATTANCSGEIPTGMAPSGTGSEAYTMLLRVNTEADVSELSSQTLMSRILDRDVLVINTQFRGMDTGEALGIFGKLRKEFPCNRIVALNGLLKVPGKPGYMYTLAGESDLAAVMLDWEEGTWAEAREGPWSEKTLINLRRMSIELESVANKIEEKPGAANTRVGIATQFRPGWDYAAFARRLAVINWKLNSDFRGYQIVQSQDRCAGAGGLASLKQLARELISQYRVLLGGGPGPNGWQKVSKLQEDIFAHLGFEISFSDDPKPGTNLPVDRDSASEAASCTEEVLDVGGAAFIYWATPKAVEAMLDTAAGRDFRPAKQS